MPTAFGGQSQQRWGNDTVNSGEYMRDFMLADLSGKPTFTADARKKGMVLVVFFEPSDSASVQLLKTLQALSDGYKDSGKLSVLGVSEEDEARTRQFGTDNGIAFPLLLDRDQYHAMTYGITRFPTAWLAGGDGTVIRKTQGFRPDTLNAMSEAIAAFAGVGVATVADDGTVTVPPPPPPAEEAAPTPAA